MFDTLPLMTGFECNCFHKNKQTMTLDKNVWYCQTEGESANFAISDISVDFCSITALVDARKTTRQNRPFFFFSWNAIPTAVVDDTNCHYY